MGVMRQAAEAAAWVLIGVAVVYALARAVSAPALAEEEQRPALWQPAVGYVLKSEMERWVWEAEQADPAAVRAIERWEREHAHCRAREVCRPMQGEPWTGR